MNSGVCIKGSNYAELESDYYGKLIDVIELEYPNPTTKRTRVVLFKCDWFDPTIDRGWRVHKQYGLVDINFKRKFMKYEPFILASQAEQVYFAEYPMKRKDRADWMAVCKIRARSMIDSPNLAYQEDDVSIPIEPVMNDDLQFLSTGDVEEYVVVDHETHRRDIEESDFSDKTEDTNETDSLEDNEDTGEE